MTEVSQVFQPNGIHLEINDAESSDEENRDDEVSVSLHIKRV